jgi:hypothetical protein|tara:strand:+ start:413 stop:1036 length:624 start_codon:yes stop_codon:yes gene_type:complete
MFKLINGLYYSEHNLILDHESILQEVIDSRKNPESSTHQSRPHQQDIDDIQHTFYEDTNLYDKTFQTMQNAVGGVVDDIFGRNRMTTDEIWGHIIPPNEQTMIHDHGDMFNDFVGLSWVYYPHSPEGAGDLCFMSNVGTNNFIYKTKQEKGKLFLFSNYVMHFTPRNSSNIDRISISGNFLATNFLKNELLQDTNYENPFWKYHGRK